MLAMQLAGWRGADQGQHTKQNHVGCKVVTLMQKCGIPVACRCACRSRCNLGSSLPSHLRQCHCTHVFGLCVLGWVCPGALLLVAVGEELRLCLMFVP